MDHGGDHPFERGLDERVCPTCRRDLRPWQDDCPGCRAPAVLRMSLPGVMPAVPAHLRDAVDQGPAEDAVDQEPAEDARAVETTDGISGLHDGSDELHDGSDELTGTDDHEAAPHHWAPEPPPVGGPLFLGGAGGGGCDGGGC